MWCCQVLDLMVRMLGFSEEEKQRIGLAQQVAGKGVVRGVLGLPGRLVGGIIGGSSHATPSGASSDNQVLFLHVPIRSVFYFTEHLIIACFCAMPMCFDTMDDNISPMHQE